MKAFKAALVGLVVASTLAVAPAATANAAPLDPGHCGVRFSGPTLAGGVAVYTVRNQCSTTYDFKVYLPGIGRYATAYGGGTCETITGYATGTYTDTYFDPNWYVQVC